MNHYVLVESSPPRQFCELDAEMDAALPRHRILLGVSPIRSAASEDGNPENPNCTITLANDRGQAAALFPVVPPVGARVVEYLEGEAIFTGVVTSVRFDEVATLTVQA